MLFLSSVWFYQRTELKHVCSIQAKFAYAIFTHGNCLLATNEIAK